MSVIELNGPVLVFGGCYGNLEATEALFAAAKARGIAASNMICTGDVVAYCADAAATARRIRDSGVPTVMGNCEESLGFGAENCGCGFEEGSACDLLSVAWYAHAVTEMDEPIRAWMRDLPRRLDVAIGGRRLAVIHGGLSNISKFMFASTPEAELDAELSLAEGDGVIGGHCGLPFTRFSGPRMWHNSGAIGMPANDGTPRVWYSVLTPGSDGLAVEHCALEYGAAAAAAKMRAAGLPEGYAAALETGLWPSLDVLPAAERAATGVALAESTVNWRAESFAA